jgi:hypothetical protein
MKKIPLYYQPFAQILPHLPDKIPDKIGYESGRQPHDNGIWLLLYCSQVLQTKAVAYRDYKELKMNSSYSSLSWTAWFKWLAITLLGLVAGLVIFIVIGSVLGETGEEAPPVIFGLVLGTIFGTTFGITQWRFLRQYIPGTGAWVPATIVAFALAAAIIFGLLNPENSESSLLLRISHATLIGLALGFAQWLVLRDKVTRPTYLWILFSLGAWIIGELTGVVLENMQVESPLPLMATFLVGASLPGIGMIWLLRQHIPSGLSEYHSADNLA